MRTLFTAIMEALFTTTNALHTLYTATMNTAPNDALRILFTAMMNALHAINHAAVPILWVMLVSSRLDVLLTKYVKYTPALPVEEPKHTPADFSVVVPTKEVPAIFLPCLRLWAKNKPKEIIISTVEEEFEKVKGAIDSDETLADLRANGYIKVVYAPEAGKRAQLIEAFKHATGSFIAMTDDHITWSETLLEGIAPCFEDAKIGACGSPIGINIPEDRRDPAIITGWEVGMARMLQKRNAGLKVAHVLGKWCWVLAGPLMVYRAKIVQDPKFLEAFSNDRWLLFCPKMDVGDDNFMSRWVQKHDWTIAIQDVHGTTILRTARRDSAMATQILRWERSTIQHFLRTLSGVPQIWRNPYVAWKTLERLTRPFCTIVHMLAWMFAAWNHPLTTLAFVAFYIYDSLPSYWAFFEEYPYMQGHWFAVLAADYCYIIQDFWGWMTLWKTTWEGRKLEQLEPVQGAGKKEEDGRLEKPEPTQGAEQKEANEVRA